MTALEFSAFRQRPWVANQGVTWGEIVAGPSFPLRSEIH